MIGFGATNVLVLPFWGRVVLRGKILIWRKHAVAHGSHGFVYLRKWCPACILQFE